jgi:hypothetical protein
MKLDDVTGSIAVMAVEQNPEQESADAGVDE